MRTFMKSQFIGDRKFYKRVLQLMIPILIQNGVTTFVNMLDNIMVGSVGQSEMTGVSIANSLIFIYNLAIFGVLAAGGIFGAQYAGKKDYKGIRDTLRFKLVTALLLTTICILILSFFNEPLLTLFLRGEGAVSDAKASLQFGKDYLWVILIGLLPYGFTMCYSSTLRENNETKMPMIAGIIAILVNLTFNYILIFGNFGAPKMGVVGAAIATVLSRFVELGILIFYTHKNHKRFPFIVGMYRHFRVPFSLIRMIFSSGIFLMLNEILWGTAQTLLTQAYSIRGLNVVAAMTIVQTFFNVFSVAFMAVGVSASIILGQDLGAGKLDTAYGTAKKLIFLSTAIGAVVGLLYAGCAFFIPGLYNINLETQELTTILIFICAAGMPLDGFAHCTYFVIRSGGKVFITLLFDAGFSWLVLYPLAFILTRYTDLTIVPIYAAIIFSTIIKVIIGTIFVRKKTWIQKIVV